MIRTLTLPLPPSLNKAYITRVGTYKRIMTTETRNYKDACHWHIKAIVKRPYAHLERVEYRFFLPDDRKRDLPDNYGKVLRDVLKGTLYADDCWQCVGVEIFGPNQIDRDNPRVEVTW